MIELTDRHCRKIRNAQAELVEEAGVGKVMELTHKSKSVVYRWKDDKASDLMSLFEALQVEGYVRRPLVTREMLGFHGLDMPTAATRMDRPGSLAVHDAEMVESASRLVVETAQARADGVITPAEATRLLELLAGAERLIPAIRDTLVAAQLREAGGDL